jgi:hypothetical protein
MMLTRHLVPLILALAVLVSSCQRLGVEHEAPTETADGRRIKVLNRLRDDLNAQYGYREGVPRINLGPCGRFAKAFREQWNTRLPETVPKVESTR